MLVALCTSASMCKKNVECRWAEGQTAVDHGELVGFSWRPPGLRRYECAAAAMLSHRENQHSVWR